jgi:hypothetical protein
LKEVRNKTREEEERERESKRGKEKERKTENYWNVVTNFNRRDIFNFTSPNLLAYLRK